MSKSVKEQLTEAMKIAMKARDKDRLEIIRYVLAEINKADYADLSVEGNRPTEQMAVATLVNMIKRGKDSAKQFEAANRLDLANRELAQIVIIEEFLPSDKFSNEDLLKMIKDAIATTNATSMRDMKNVIDLVNPQIQGRADVDLVISMIRQELQS